jgi:methyl-accepting chemotaxis protein
MRRTMSPRRIKVIDNVFQYRLIAVLLAVVLAGLVTFALASVVVAAAAGGLSLAALRRMYSALPPILLNDLVIMVLLIIMGIFMTHRIAGPVYRVQKDIERVLDGEKGVRVKFRKGDSFPELAEKVNSLIERIDGTRPR